MTGYMHEAIKQAKCAFKEGEIPVGAVIVKEGRVISTAYNRTQEMNDFTYHAEMTVLRDASKTLGAKYLTGCELYVTLEPCPMCAGAILLTRISRVYFGAYDTLNGALGSAYDLSLMKNMPKPEIYGGINEEECKELLTGFFRNKR